MRFRKSVLLSVCTVTACLLASAACNFQPPGKATGTVLDVEVGEPVREGLQPLTASLSTNRPRLIRNDAREGGAILVATASENVTFAWCVEVIDPAIPVRELPAPCSVADDVKAAAELLEFTMPPSNGSGPVSTLTIERVLQDPGANGRSVRVTASATEAGVTTDEPFVETDNTKVNQVILEIVRPASELAVTITSDAARVAPRGLLEMTAVISGGTPFPAPSSGDRGYCGVPADCNEFSPPDLNPPYCITWTLHQQGLGSGAPACGVVAVEALRPGANGETLSDLTYSVPLAVGSVSLRVEVSDQRGKRASATLAMAVNSDVPLTIAEASSSGSPTTAGDPDERLTDLAPGDETTLTVRGAGGEPPYIVRFELAGSNVVGGVLSAPSCTISTAKVADGCSITYKAPDDDVGTELIRVALEDAVHSRDGTTVSVPVASPQALRVTLFAEDVGLPPASGTPLETRIVGGTPPYYVCYVVSAGSLSAGDPPCAPIDLNEDWVGCACGLGDLATRGLTPVLDERTYTAPPAEAEVSLRVRVTDGVGAVDEDIIPIAVHSEEHTTSDSPLETPFSVRLESSEDMLCFGQTANLTAETQGGTEPNTYEFKLVGGLLDASEEEKLTYLGDNEAAYRAPNSTTGFRKIEVTAREAGGSVRQATVEIETVESPIANAGDDHPNVCVGAAPFSVGGSAGNPTAQNVIAPYEHLWDGTGAQYLGNTTAENPTFTPPATTGTFGVCVTVTDASACDAVQDCAQIIVHPNPVADASNDGPVCADEGVPLKAATVDPALDPVTYSWEGPGGYTSNEQNPVRSPAIGGDYTLTVESAAGCVDSDVTTVVVNPLPDATISAGDVCKDTSGNAASVPDAGATYAWVLTNGTIEGPDDANSITYTVADVASVTVEVTVTNGFNCVSSSTLVVNVNDNPDAAIFVDPVAVCGGSTGNTASVAPAGGEATYVWTITGGSFVGAHDTASVIYAAGNGATVEIGVTVTHSNGCVATGSTIVNVTDPACEDFNPCTDDYCAAGICHNDNNSDPCTDDLNECTTDVCDGGACTHPPVDDETPCADEAIPNDCTNDVCRSGVCEHEAKPDGDACGNQIPQGVCDRSDACASGICVENLRPDTFECRPQAGVCNPAETCDGVSVDCPANEFTPEGTPCTSDGNDCTNDVCDASGECAHNVRPAGSACGEQVPQGVCDQPDVCNSAGICLPNYRPASHVCRGAADNCDAAEKCSGFSNDCPDDAFSPPGTPCGDSTDTVCDHADTCDGNGVCRPNYAAPDTLCGNPSGTECTDPDMCDGNGNCAANHEPDGAPCGVDSSTECDDPDSCLNGVCENNHWPDETPCTPDADDCTADVCLAGICDHVPREGLPCDDGNWCTVDDSCNPGGQCKAGPDRDCADTVPCTDDWCNEVDEVCEHDPNDANCDNGKFCDGQETCDAVLDCQPGTDPCDDGRPCTTDPCNEGTGCEAHVVIALTCLIDDVCYDDLDENPANDCQECDWLADQHGWSNKDEGESCAGDGVDCTDDACVAGTCESTVNDANCPDDSLYCTGVEYCDPVSDCSSTGDPCEANETCNELTDSCDPG